MRIGVGKRIIGGFMLMILMLLIVGGNSLTQFNNADNLTEEIQSTYFVRYAEAEAAATNVWKMVASIRAFVILGDEAQFSDYQAANEANDQLINELIHGSLSAEGRKIGEEIQRLDDAYDQIIQGKVYPLIKDDNIEMAICDCQVTLNKFKQIIFNT